VTRSLMQGIGVEGLEVGAVTIASLNGKQIWQVRSDDTLKLDHDNLISRTVHLQEGSDLGKSPMLGVNSSNMYSGCSTITCLYHVHMQFVRFALEIVFPHSERVP
jgi:hypothetical protein